MKTPIKQTAHRLAAVLAIITALVTTGAWAANWTVSENTTLTEDKTVDALTVNSGVTVDLAGYSLTCSSLAGSGTITSTSADLTTPSGTVTWITKFGTENATQNGLVRTGTNPNATTPANLFNDFNGEAAPGSNVNNDSKRLLATTDNLPLAVTYDFGDGTPKKVNAYKMVAVRADHSTNNVRCPKTWTFEGSNGNDEWTPLHSTNNVSWASGSSPKEFSFSNDTAYRYYRITFTESSDGVGSNKYLELNQLEYFGPGELHVNVPAGAEATVESLTISGNMKVVSEGTDSFTIDADVDVKELVFNDGASATLTVDEGKTLTTENINGIGKIINNGTIVKTGTGTVDWPFDRQFRSGQHDDFRHGNDSREKRNALCDPKGFGWFGLHGFNRF